MLKNAFIFFLVFMAWVWASFALSSAGAPDEQFKQALSFYSEGDFGEARIGFEKLTLGFPADQRFSVFSFMLCKCDYHLGDYATAETGFKNFINEFPGSLYLGHAHFFLGNISYHKGDKLGAAQEYIKAYDYAGDEELRSLAHNSLIPLLERGLGPKEQATLLRQSRGRKLADEVIFRLAQREMTQGDWVRARELLAEYVENYPNFSHFKEAKTALAEISQSSGRVNKIGVLVPLSGEHQAGGQSLLRGIESGKRDYCPGRVELIVKDTGGSPIQTAHKAKELIEESNVIAVIGPAEEDCVLPAVVVSDCFSIPLISPIASREGIATLGRYVFQLTTSTEKMARGVAQYATRDKGWQQFVILAPDDVYGRDAARGFQEEVAMWGGRVVACEFYARESTDFGSQLEAIREKIFKEKAMDGGDTAKYVDASGKPLPLEEIELEVDGFFLPGYGEDIILIAPQIPFSKIKTNLLGTREWKNKRIIELCRDYVQNAVFAWDCSEVLDSSDFTSSYEKTYLEKPDRISALGYDSFGFLALALGSGASTCEEIGEYLSDVRYFKGASGEMKFNSGHENENFSLFVIEGNQFKKLK